MEFIGFARSHQDVASARKSSGRDNNQGNAEKFGLRTSFLSLNRYRVKREGSFTMTRATKLPITGMKEAGKSFRRKEVIDEHFLKYSITLFNYQDDLWHFFLCFLFCVWEKEQKWMNCFQSVTWNMSVAFGIFCSLEFFAC
jgi:hypothetical protein